jgi:uncharacterized protein
MKLIENDFEYQNLVEDILENEDFCKLKYIEHHATNKYAHSVRISYYAYKLAKILKLDEVAVARAGLLHDFAISKNGRNFKERFIETFTHPKVALGEAKKRFYLSTKEENIIVSHMFPFYTALPKYAESWLVVAVDKTIGSYELFQKFSAKALYFANMYILILFSIIK